jgi:glyoxylase-like metal-dependent hydrolase (beta-lactamase superfamily II)
MFSGDLLFEGSIGRTDLPGGDHATMLETLRHKVLTLPDDVVVLPGHGGQTSIGRERATNPFLLDLLPAGADGPADAGVERVTRGL